MNNSVVKIEGHEVSKIEYKGIAVLTLKMVDELHERVEGTARKAFNRHKERFTEGEHYFDIAYEEWAQILVVHITDDQKTNGTHRGSMIFITELGYLLLVKPFNDDRAWRVQNSLVKGYFAIKTAIENKNKPLVEIFPETEAALKLAALFGLEGNQAKLCADKAVKTKTGESPLALIGCTYLVAEKQERHMTATELGKPLGISAVKVNKLLAGAGIIEQKRDHKNKIYYIPTEKGKEYTVLLDTAKAHSDGTPIQQVRYYESARKFLKDVAA